MVRYHCVVLRAEEGWAEVLIRPEACHLVCAPDEIDKKLCHCATDGSNIVIKAKDPIGVRPGDEVLIHQIPKVSLGTWLKLLLPLLSGTLGYIFFWGKWAYVTLGAGVLAGTSLFTWDLLHKDVPPPVIERVMNPVGTFKVDPVGKKSQEA